MLQKLGKEEFEQALKTNGKLVVVDFMTEWCPYCKMLAPLMEDIAGEHINDIAVYRVDIDEVPDIGERYDIMTVPTVFVFRDGEVKGSAVNPRTKEALYRLIFLYGTPVVQ